MKKSIIFLLLATLCLVACKKEEKYSNYYSVTEAALVANNTSSWQVSFAGNEVLPDWQEPDPSMYENWMVMLIELEDELKPTIHPDDRIAVFVNNELRGLTAPAIAVGENSEDDSGLFILKSFGNEDENNIEEYTLRYYSATLHQLFTYTMQIRLELGKVYGLDTPFVPAFTYGATSYPVILSIFVTFLPLEDSDVKPAKGDILAAFVGDECRGTLEMDDDMWLSPMCLTTFARNSEETVTFKYFHATSGRIFTFVPTVTSDNSMPSVTIRM